MTLPDKLTAKEFSRLREELDVTQQHIADMITKSHTHVRRLLNEHGIYLKDYSEILRHMGIDEKEFMQNIYPKIKEAEIEAENKQNNIEAMLEEILAGYERKNDIHFEKQNKSMDLLHIQTKTMIKEALNAVSLEFKQQFADYQIQLKKVKSDFEYMEREIKNLYLKFDDFQNFQEKIMTLTKEQIDLKIKDYDLELQKDLERDYRQISRQFDAIDQNNSSGLGGILQALVPAVAPTLSNMMMNNYQSNQKANLSGLNSVEPVKETSVPEEPKLVIPDEEFSLDNAAFGFELYELLQKFGYNISEKDFLAQCSEFIENIEEMMYYEEIVYLLKDKIGMSIPKEQVKHMTEQYRRENNRENEENTNENTQESSKINEEKRTVQSEQFEQFNKNNLTEGFQNEKA